MKSWNRSRSQSQMHEPASFHDGGNMFDAECDAGLSVQTSSDEEAKAEPQLEPEPEPEPDLLVADGSEARLPGSAKVQENACSEKIKAKATPMLATSKQVAQPVACAQSEPISQ